MKGIVTFLAAALVIASSLAGLKPLATVPNYDGKFRWVKLGDASPPVVAALSRGGSIALQIAFAHDVRLKKDKNGNAWFTVLLADQGTDWNWHQTSRSAAVPDSGGVIRSGIHTVSISLAGIPQSVLRDKKQTLSLGPGASGLAGRISFTVLGFKAR
jgi:hypothetical protein